MSRFFERTVTNPELFGYGFETLTRELRTRAWDAEGDRNPALTATAADPLIIDIDATLVTPQSDKEDVAGTYKGGYGFAPFIVSCDYGAGNSSGEILATVLRPGYAGANSAEDHIRVFHTAAAQLPESFFNEAEATRWARTCSSAPSRCTPGAQPTLLDIDGHRITAFLTNSPRWHGPFLDARHRARGRCENRIKTLNNTGLGKLPFFDFAANQAWADIAALAFNLVSWIQLAALPDGHHAKAWVIKRWRYRLFATAGKIITRARRTQLLLSELAPENNLLKLLLENNARLNKGLVPSSG